MDDSTCLRRQLSFHTPLSDRPPPSRAIVSQKAYKVTFIWDPNCTRSPLPMQARAKKIKNTKVRAGIAMQHSRRCARVNNLRAPGTCTSSAWLVASSWISVVFDAAIALSSWPGCFSMKKIVEESAMPACASMGVMTPAIAMHAIRTPDLKRMRRCIEPNRSSNMRSVTEPTGRTVAQPFVEPCATKRQTYIIDFLARLPQRLA